VFIRKHLVGDVIIFVLTVWASYGIRLNFINLGAVGDLAALQPSIWQMAIASAAAKPTVFWALGIYRIYWGYFGSDEFIRLLGAVVAASATLILVVLMLRSFGLVPMFPRSVILIDFGLSLALVSLYRKVSYSRGFGPKGSGAG
jgi:FlaA1/EpsC-like NDP-sugar epimerase